MTNVPSKITFDQIKQLIESYLQYDLSEEIVDAIKKEILILESHFDFIPDFVINVLHKELIKFPQQAATITMLSTITFLNMAAKIKLNDENSESLNPDDLN